jgi:hypothetical protein
MTSTFRDRVATFLKAHEGEWLPAIAFEPIGGRQAWRSRIADCRTQLGMAIDNRCRLVKRHDGTSYRLSEYRFTAPAPKGQGVLFQEQPSA